MAKFGAILLGTHWAGLKAYCASDFDRKPVQIGFEDMSEGFDLITGENDPIPLGKKKVEPALREIIHPDFHFILQLMRNRFRGEGIWGLGGELINRGSGSTPHISRWAGWERTLEFIKYIRQACSRQG